MSNAFYFPSLNEISVTLMLCVVGMWAFKLVIENFPVFSEELEFEKPVGVIESISNPLTLSE